MRRILIVGLLALAGLVIGFKQGEATEPCAIMPVQALLAAIPVGEQFALNEGMLAGLDLLEIAPPSSEEAGPDGALVVAWGYQPLLVVLTRGECVVGVFRIEQRELWAALLQGIGPAI